MAPTPCKRTTSSTSRKACFEYRIHGSGGMNATQIWRVIYARRHMIIALTMTIVAIVAGVSLLMPKKYRAELAIVVDIKGSNPLNDAALAPQLVPSYLTTQAQIIASRNVA